MTKRTLIRAQSVLASVAALFAGVGAVWSWRVGDRHGPLLALIILASAATSTVLARLVTRTHLDDSA